MRGQSSRPNVASFYSGGGGLDLGFHQAGFHSIFANDTDGLAIANYSKLLASNMAVVGDIRAVALPPSDQVDVVIGGPPCQGFSVAGRMDPLDPRSRHVWHFLEVVSKLKPRCYVMENVKALATNSRWQQLRHSLETASRLLGYQTRIFTLKASHFGVPQNRERMFMVGCLGTNPSEPSQTSPDANVPSRYALQELPDYGTPGNWRFATAAITMASSPVLRRSMFAGMLFNGSGRPINLDGPGPTLPASMGGNKTPIVDQEWLESGGESHWLKHYHEHLMSGGAPLPFDAAPPQLRRLTAEEAARLQSFPIEHDWIGSTSSVFRIIGNAVPPLLAQAVAASVLNDLERSDSKRSAKRHVPTMDADSLVHASQSELALF